MPRLSRFLCNALPVLLLCLLSSISAYAGPLDDYYLTQYSAQKTGNVFVKSAALATDVEVASKCGTPLKHGLSRDWNKLEAATQKVLAKQLALPTLSASLSSSGGHFTIHYDTSGTNAPNITAINQYTGLGLTSATDWASKVGDSFEFAFSSYQSQGYNPPPNLPYDVYLTSLASAGEYGFTQDIQRVSTVFPYASSSFIEIDKDFTNSIFRPGTYTPLQSLQVTSAHEFHHAIQYGYNYFFDIWFAEATSTWMEDELYDGVNQNYEYIPAWFSNSSAPLDLAVGYDAVSSGAGYGRWIFNRYLSEKHGSPMIRSAWEKIVSLPSPGGYADIPMAPVLDTLLSSTYGSSLDNDIFGFAKRVYTRDWTTHTSEIGKIHVYSPIGTYAAYPVNITVSTPTPSITLPHYSFAYYKFTPTVGVTPLTVSINKTSGIKTALFKKDGGVLTEIAADAAGTYVVNDFGTTDEVVLLIANTTSIDGENANFSTDDSLQTVTEPTGGSLVNGTCGTSNGGVFTVIPTANLCFTGTASSLSGIGPWSWSCSGGNGGVAANCSANIQSYIVSFAAGNGGILIGTTNQTVNYGASATALAAAASTGYHFVNWTGTGGFVATTANPLTVSNVTTSQSITANFAADVVAVNGTCGTSNGSTYTVIPTANLCTSGIASTVTGTGPWTWSCGGFNGGGSAACFANFAAIPPTQFTVVPIIGTGFNIAPSTPQTLTNNATTSFSVTSSSGYGIASVSGCGGSFTGTTYTTGAITANCSISVTAVARNASSGSSPTISDALKVLQAVVGTTPLTASEKIRYDVAPFSPNGIPLGNGIIDSADIIAILRRTIGIGNW